jgi:hypothetical protein
MIFTEFINDSEIFIIKKIVTAPPERFLRGYLQELGIFAEISPPRRQVFKNTKRQPPPLGVLAVNSYTGPGCP